MNTNKNNNSSKGVKVTLADLKRLGKQGHATACLTDGTIVELCERYVLKESSAYINHQQTIDTVKVILLHTDIYDRIRTIKYRNQLVARRGKKYLEFVSKNDAKLK